MKKLSLRQRIAITARGFGILKQYCPGLAQGRALEALIGSLQPFVTIWLSARVIDEITGQRRLNVVLAAAAGVLLANFFCAVVRGVIRRICDEKESQMWNWFGKIFSDKAMTLDFVDLEDAAIQRQRQAAEENLYMFGNGLAQLVWGTASLVQAAVNILASLAMTVTLFTSRSGGFADHPVCMVGVLLVLLLAGMFNAWATKRENQIFKKWCSSTVWYNRVFTFFGRELYMNPERAKDVRIYRQDVPADKMLSQLDSQDQADTGPNLQMSAYPGAGVFAAGLANGLCWLYVVAKAFWGAFGLGSVVQYAAVLTRLGEGIKEMTFILADNAVYCGHLAELYAYLDLPNRMYQGTLTVEKREDSEYDIEFRNVSFRYPNADTYALHHVSLKFKIGERLAVVGMNGSGKTTFIKLLCRLYDPTEGEILLNHVDIRKYDYQEYISLFSVVFQDFRLFAFDLGQNVAADAVYDREKALLCLEKAGDRLSHKHQGLETGLYKNFDASGVEISGGEAQKIALARALYKNAPLIILDEPTAALDPISEYEIYSSFNDIAGEKTAVYISHRLASCRFCDKIAVFHQGEIVQLGSHEELLAQKSQYQALWEAQAQYYRDK